MFIQTESTPNPATLKFLPGQTVLAAGTADFPDARRRRKLAAGAPDLRASGGVAGVFFGPDFVTVTKADGRRLGPHQARASSARSWSISSPAPPVIEGEAGAGRPRRTRRRRRRDRRARSRSCSTPGCGPAVAQDGGDITFHGFDRGVVYLHMQGACAGCPSSTMTLKMGIENLLRHYIPEVTEVRPVARLTAPPRSSPSTRRPRIARPLCCRGDRRPGAPRRADGSAARPSGCCRCSRRCWPRPGVGWRDLDGARGLHRPRQLHRRPDRASPRRAAWRWRSASRRSA